MFSAGGRLLAASRLNTGTPENRPLKQGDSGCNQFSSPQVTLQHLRLAWART